MIPWLRRAARPVKVMAMDDALRPAPDASYEAQLARPYLDQAEQALASAMIGRPLRSRSAAAVRCGWGLPAVLRVDPRLDDGTPFPTTLWLACPLAVRHVGRLEAEQMMVGMNHRLETEEDFAEAYAGAHHRYRGFRERLGPPLPRASATAGGMPKRVKCLHALYAHHLATLDNPVGEAVAEQVEPMSCLGPCVRLEPDEVGA